ncbi:MAG: hypothetical protein NVV73_16160 [Cellvibrionaceae bacterium]|nr:hypothetical protein [Cellvibrionaceae bacterium]
MQRYTRPSVLRRPLNFTRTSTTRVTPQNAQRLNWKAAALCATLAVTSVTAGSGRESALKEDGMAAQGHAKRYMRINEYLFHGTQKGTAIALRIEGSKSDSGLVDRNA